MQVVVAGVVFVLFLPMTLLAYRIVFRVTEAAGMMDGHRSRQHSLQQEVTLLVSCFAFPFISEMQRSHRFFCVEQSAWKIKLQASFFFLLTAAHDSAEAVSGAPATSQ